MDINNDTVFHILVIGNGKKYFDHILNEQDKFNKKQLILSISDVPSAQEVTRIQITLGKNVITGMTVFYLVKIFEKIIKAKNEAEKDNFKINIDVNISNQILVKDIRNPNQIVEKIEEVIRTIFQSSDLILFYNENLSLKHIHDFKNNLSYENLNLTTHPTNTTHMFACMEWYIPAAIVLFISQSYFGSFLSEMGKEHYQILKKKLSNFTSKTMSNSKLEPTLIGSPGKVNSNNPYSLSFSISAEAMEGKHFKLLIPKELKSEDYFEISHTFLDFLENYYSGTTSLNDIGCDIEGIQRNHYIFVHMNLATRKIEWLDERVSFRNS